MPLQYEITTVHMEGDVEDVLFTLPPPARAMREGDVITYAPVGEASVKYKIETVEYIVRDQIPNPNLENQTSEFGQPEVFYGVSIANL